MKALSTYFELFDGLRLVEIPRAALSKKQSGAPEWKMAIKATPRDAVFIFLEECVYSGETKKALELLLRQDFERKLALHITTVDYRVPGTFRTEGCTTHSLYSIPYYICETGK